MQVPLVYVFASEVIVEHKAAEVVVPSILHEAHEVFVPIGVCHGRRLKEALNEGDSGAQLFYVALCAFLANIHAKGHRGVGCQI